jgi:hypothetical protein
LIGPGSAALAWALVIAAFSAASADRVSGYVIDGNTGARLDGVEVAFLVTQEGQTREILRKPSDAHGEFSFAGPFIAPGLEFALLAFYGGASYPTTELNVGNQKEIILEVFDSTDQPGALRIANYHLFLHLKETHLEVGNLVEMENLGDKTYSGTGTGVDRQVTEFQLPAGAFNLTGNLSQVGGRLFFDNQPLPPGKTQISFTYHVSTRDLVDGYPFESAYETEALDVYLQPSSLASGELFQDLGEVEFHDTRYRRLHLPRVEASHPVLIPLPLTKPLRWLIKWGALAVALVGGPLVLALFRTRSADAAPALAAQLEVALDQLALLDDANAVAPDDPKYRRERELRLAEAVELRLRLDQGTE